MREKRQNDANLLIVLVIATLRLSTNKCGIEPEKRSQFPAGGMGRGREEDWSVELVASGERAARHMATCRRPNGGVGSRYRFRFCRGIGRCIASRVY